ncbi:MAG: thiamine biosynthesis lipoprotein [Saprospiraceae bacterium]|jgi:thiamine biosynthesis lipoprotein
MMTLTIECPKISTPQSKAHHHSIKLMGCHFVITAIHHDPDVAWNGIRSGVSEIQRIEKLISSWTEDSETTKININAGVAPVKVSSELFNLIFRSLKVSELTSGAFDISGTLSRYYWNFNGAKNQFLPSEKIEELRALINYKHIVLDKKKQSVFLKKKGMKIGFGGIGKGYAAQRAKEVLYAMGIESGLINASGDLMCWGTPPNRNDWQINIPDPCDNELSILEISIPHGSIVSSGDSENYTLIDGERYSHIVDPRTALPVRGVRNATVISANPELADALATAISVLGVIDGIELVNQLNGIECMVIDQDNQKHYSNNLQSSFN